MAATQKQIDWELIEGDFRSGIKSVLQIANEHDISHTAINKRFKKLGITRDLSARIKAKTEAMVSAALVSGSVSTLTTETEVDIIDAVATKQTTILVRQQKTIERKQSLVEKLLDELEHQTINRETYEQLGELMHAPDENGRDKLHDIYMKSMGTSGRVDTAKKLAETLKVLVGLERQAVGIADNSNGEADKPKEIPSQLHDKDAARRIAFMLLGAERETA